MQKELKDMTIDDLVSWGVRRCMDALFSGGGKEMKTAMYLVISKVLEWSQIRQKENLS